MHWFDVTPFAVLFDPPLPLGPSAVVPADLDWPLVYQLSLGLKPRALTYVINGKPWGYDYADPYVVLDDLMSEITALDRGSSHPVLMSGYPVVDVKMGDDLVTFHQLDFPEGWSAEMEIVQVREALTTAANMLWGVISNPMREAESGT